MTEDLREADDAGRRRWRGACLGDRPRLVLASFLMLFVELALIRWTSANNLYLIHLTNFVLLASFLGIGLGFLLARSERDLFALVPVSLGLLVAFVLAFPVQTVDDGGAWRLGGALGMGPLPRWVSLPVDLPAHRRRAGRARAGGGPDLRPVRAAGGVPAGRARQPRRDRRLRRAVLPPAAAARLGAAQPRPCSWCCSAAGPGAWQVAGVAARGRAARRPVAARRLPLVAVLQDPRGRRRRAAAVRVDVNNTPHQTAHSLARLRPATTPSTATRTRTCTRARRRADHRRRHRQRRGGRAGRGRPARSTRWRSTRCCSSSAGSGTRSGPTPTRG